MIAELSGLFREQIAVSREILTRLEKFSPKPEDHGHKPPAQKTPDQKEPARKPGHEKPPADIMIGS
jgi:hypothetical protein